MTVQITLSQLEKLAPSARSSYRNTFSSAQSILGQYEITSTPLRVAHFMAQILHESGVSKLALPNGAPRAATNSLTKT